MTDNPSDSATGLPLNLFEPGDRLRITTGKLSGLTGVVRKLPTRADHVLAIEGWPEGMYLIVTDAAVAQLAPDGGGSS